MRPWQKLLARAGHLRPLLLAHQSLPAPFPDAGLTTPEPNKSLHYYAGDRDDTEYWRDTRKIALSDSLREQFDIWSARLPGAKNVYESYHGFGSHSWSVMLLGLNRPPASNLPVLDAMSPAPGLALLEGIKADADRLVRDLPSAYEYLTEMRRANQQAPGG